MFIQVKKLLTAKNKQGFTLLELTVSLFLLVILTLLLMLILQTTITTSKRFLDYTNYEYGLAHKKILEIYNNSAKVKQEHNYILLKSKEFSNKSFTKKCDCIPNAFKQRTHFSYPIDGYIAF